jgi:hypothetical protein
MCKFTDIGCGVQQAFQTVASNMFSDLISKLGEGATTAIQALTTFWIKIPTPEVATQTGNSWQAAKPIAFLHGYSMAIAAVVFTFAILFAGIQTAWVKRGEPIRELLRTGLVLVVVTGMGTATIQVLSTASDLLAIDIVSKATPKNETASSAIRGLVIPGTGEAAGPNQLPMFLLMFSCLGIMLMSMIQVVLLLIRSAMLVLLAGTFPIAAAATNTEAGKAWFKKYCAWTIAFIAYKPAAALVYAAGLKMNQAGVTSVSGNSLVQALTGWMMMVLAVVALPALLRFAVPVTAAVAGGSVGSGVGDPGGLATGAINMGRSSGRAGGPSGAGSGGGGGGGGGSAGKATGAASVGAALGVAGAAVTGAKKAAGAISGAASHSAGEAGGGSSGSGAGGSGGGGGGRSGSSAKAPAHAGPSGSG